MNVLGTRSSDWLMLLVLTGSPSLLVSGRPELGARPLLPLPPGPAAGMAGDTLSRVPDVDIDSDGVFKYVLIRVTPKGAGPGKEVVRGYAWAEYHADIYDKIAEELEKQGFHCECLGGGRISHQSATKKIHVYGYSVGFGRAKHSVSTEKLKVWYPDYAITWADEGY